ncbi:hypothetical protein Syncc8109_1953 [Synechococcus sp. WH 8109]|nr:hypothetical protein Syncc8109_1953 [Synechococcus sp. WH 8109]
MRLQLQNLLPHLLFPLL